MCGFLWLPLILCVNSWDKFHVCEREFFELCVITSLNTSDERWEVGSVACVAIQTTLKCWVRFNFTVQVNSFRDRNFLLCTCPLAMLDMARSSASITWEGIIETLDVCSSKTDLTRSVSKPSTLPWTNFCTRRMEATLLVTTSNPTSRSAVSQRAWSLISDRILSPLWLFLNVVASLAIVARAKGGLQGEARGRAAESLSTGDGHWCAVKHTASGRHIRFIEGHHLVVQ